MAPLHTKKWSGFAPSFEIKDTKSKEHIITQMAICQSRNCLSTQLRGGGLDNWGHKPNQNSIREAGLTEQNGTAGPANRGKLWKLVQGKGLAPGGYREFYIVRNGAVTGYTHTESASFSLNGYPKLPAVWLQLIFLVENGIRKKMSKVKYCSSNVKH